MSQRLVTPYVNTNIPGTYVNYQVLTQPTGVSSSGIAVIMGEANGGPSYDQIEIWQKLFHARPASASYSDLYFWPNCRCFYCFNSSF